MNMLVPVLGALVLLVLAWRLAREVRRDGLGSNPTPRSHLAELGGRADRQLGR